MHERIILLFVAVFTLTVAGPDTIGDERTATIYFVDPANGNDDHHGTTKQAPWKTIPGTRNIYDRGWLRGAWGSITNSNKIQSGDIIYIRAGTTFNASTGGRLLINSEFYENGTILNPITISVDASWGQGHTEIDAKGIKLSSDSAFVSVESLDHIYLSGAGPDHMLLVKNIQGEGVWGIGLLGTKYKKQKGSKLSHIAVAHSGYGGVTVAHSDDWLISNSQSHHNKAIGFDVGGINDHHSNNGRFRDTEAFANGNKGSTDIAHGFALYGATNITYERCKAYANARDGFDFGTVGNNRASSATVIDSMAFDNAEDGFAANGAYDAARVNNTFTYIRSIAYNNAQSGWHIYGGADAFLYHVISHHNGSQQNFGGNYMIYSSAFGPDVYTTSATIRNSIGIAPKKHVNVYSYDSGGIATRIDSDFNIFVPRHKDTENAAELPYGITHDYKGSRTWAGKNDCIGLHCNPKFIHIDTEDFWQNDYHLSPDSPAIDAGVVLNIDIPRTMQFSGRDISNAPDIGVYESTPKNNSDALDN